jgi:hypothetical protein
VQDSWKVRPTLSINMGLRWDYSSNPYEKNGRLSQLKLGQGSNFIERIAGTSVQPVEELLEIHRKAYLAPRLNIAWDPTGTGKISVRLGMGVFFNRWPNKTWSDATRNNSPWQTGIVADTRVPTSPQPIFRLCGLDAHPWDCPVPGGLRIGLNERGGPLTGIATIGGTAPDFRYAYSINRFFGVQYALSNEWILEADYLGSRGNHLYTVINRNRIPGDLADGVLNRLNPFFANINYADTSGWSNYNGGTIGVRKRPSSGLGLQFSYTFGKTTSVSDAQGPGFASANSPIYRAYDVNAQKGPASFDVSHAANFSVIYELPTLASAHPAVRAILGGWQSTTLTTLQSGLPFTVTHGGQDWDQDGQFGDLPNAPSFGNSLSVSRSDYIRGVFRAADFPAPTLGTQGNVGRNTYRGPGYANVDFSIMKNFPFHVINEQSRFQIRAEMFNVFNRVNLNGFNTNMAAGTFGQSTATFYPRTIQLGLRFDF